MIVLDQKNNRSGFIIVVTLILILVMTTMGVGLFYSSKQAAKEVSSHVDKKNYLVNAESCITEAIDWLEDNYSSCLVGSVCKTIKSNNGMAKWDIGESDKRKRQMNLQKAGDEMGHFAGISI